MKQIMFTSGELDSLRTVVDYLMDSEQKHYEETAFPDNLGHIYLHVKKVERVLAQETE